MVLRHSLSADIAAVKSPDNTEQQQPRFQRRLPPYACSFLEMCLMITADHGPAVSGAHNTIVCARAGKDLVSSLVSGLLTIVSCTSFTHV